MGEGRRLRAADADRRIVPDPPPPLDADDVSLDVWGFRDTRFRVRPSGAVELTGGRYALSGPELPDLLPWIRGELRVELDPFDARPSGYPPEVPKPLEMGAFLSEVSQMLGPGGLSQDSLVRLRHGHGHTQDEMYAIKYGRIGRVPDLVVYPERDEHVAALVASALRHGVSLIPFGGGTNVSQALRCPEGEERPIVSVDMSRMRRVLWIDPTNHMACIQAGAVGRDIAAQLATHGFTLGHEPDSVEFSTLGGWIATHASGMKKNRYGNIEDLVLDLNVVTAQGELWRAGALPRESVGVDPRRVLFGSEGNLGIITRAVVKIFPLPEVQRYDSVLLPDFEAGLAFLYDLAREGVLPASVRLVDNLQFQFAMALRPAARGLHGARRRLERLFVTRVRGFDPARMVATTLVFEGGREEVARQESAVRRIARRHGGMRAGSENGERGYQLTFGIAYIRDFAITLHILGESFETSVPWSRVSQLCENVKRRVRDEHAKRRLPGQPFVTCRVTQLYDTGVCVYFYFAYYHKGVADPSGVYAEIERAARDEILRSGGSLSHHHGVGKLRQRFLPEVMSPAALEWSRRVKDALDPHDVFGAANARSEA